MDQRIIDLHLDLQSANSNIEEALEKMEAAFVLCEDDFTLASKLSRARDLLRLAAREVGRLVKGASVSVSKKCGKCGTEFYLSDLTLAPNGGGDLVCFSCSDDILEGLMNIPDDED